ncbi:inorganic phosphate transporter [Anderseniella sp. Alg231-50]|uniref:inorganic phosphate transporter n=1 Tax=Anderseniella sp. Alg231-50 TaxID=1922226 RepID=UPI000D54B332
MSDDVQPDAPQLRKTSLDKDLSKLSSMETATRALSMQLLAPGLAIVFLACAGLLAAAYSGENPNSALIVAAAIIGGYMALNIGANDVANNVGPAVGSKAMSLMAALVIAAVFESAGAIIAGGDVVSTISKGIVDPKQVADANTFVWAMMAALLSCAMWVNLATWLGAPVSTTHSVVGGVMGAGIAAAGFSVVNWGVMGAIAASWVISPLLGGGIAALFLWFIKSNIIYQDDKIAAARKWVPVLVSIMLAAFTCYLVMKGLKKVWKPDLSVIAMLGLAVFGASVLVLRPIIRTQSQGMENRNQSLRKLFHIPLIFSAMLLSFAHGANDVANAVGPLAAILHTIQSGSVDAKVGIPLWVMMIGAFGISLGLFLYGPKLIRMVGEQITKMNPMRAFCVALSAAITVLIASGLGLPVSSTHIAVGGVFGVGFLREYYTTHSKRRRTYLARKAGNTRFTQVQADERSEDEIVYRKLVRRSHFMTIVAAWLITVPATAVLAGALYFVLQQMG